MSGNKVTENVDWKNSVFFLNKIICLTITIIDIKV